MEKQSFPDQSFIGDNCFPTNPQLHLNSPAMANYQVTSQPPEYPVSVSPPNTTPNVTINTTQVPTKNRDSFKAIVTIALAILFAGMVIIAFVQFSTWHKMDRQEKKAEEADWVMWSLLSKDETILNTVRDNEWVEDWDWREGPRGGRREQWLDSWWEDMGGDDDIHSHWW